MFKRLSISILSLLIIFSSLPSLVFAHTEKIAHLENQYIDVSINKKNGRFSIQTKEGHPLRDHDREKPLLFNNEMPDTSYTTFRINGNDYIYGNNYGLLGTNGSLAYQPTSQGLVNQSMWRVEGLEIVQTLTLVNDRDNPNLGNVRIAYEVTNVSDDPVQIGSRILLDTMLGAQDASPITFPGYEHFVQTETEITGDIPAYWRAVDDPLAPNVMSYGFLHGWGNESADRLMVAHWEGISRTKWDYEVNEHLNFTSRLNEYRSADSAFALYWDPAELRPGEQKVFETFYGLGSFTTSYKSAKYDTQLIAPKQLIVNEAKDGYVEDEFTIQLIIDNTTSQAETMTNVAVEIGLPDELELVDDEQFLTVIPSLEEGESKDLMWRVKAKPQRSFTAAQYWVSVNADDIAEVLQANFIVLPALSGALPEVHILDVLPNKLNAANEDLFVYVKGSGFEALHGNWDAQLELIRERDGHRYPLHDVQVSDDQQMVISLNDIWEGEQPEAGQYTLHIDAGEFGSFSHLIEVTEDPKYLSRSYGIVAVVAEGKTNSIVPITSEAELAALKRGNTQRLLLEIRGEVEELPSDKSVVYRAKPGATINSVIHFTESPIVRDLFSSEQMMVIEKKQKDDDYDNDYVEISGAGVLSVPTFPFMTGGYSIVLEDSKEYALEATGEQLPIEVEWETYEWLESVQRMSFFPVTIRNAIIGDQTVTFGGTLGINFSTKKKDDDTEAIDNVHKKRKIKPQIGIDIQEALFGITDDDEFEFIGLRTEGVVGLPKDTVPGLNMGAQARVKLDTLDDIFEIEVDVAFKLIEFYGLLTVKFTESSIPIVDNIILAAGFEPGIPLVPPKVIAYITKGGGGFRNLHATVTGDFEVLPPLALVIIGSLDIAKAVTLADMKLEASLRGIDFEGAIDIMKFRLFKHAYGSIKIEDSLSKFAVSAKIGGTIDIFDVLIGQAEATLTFDSSQNNLFGPVTMGGSGKVTLKVPKSVPLVGGYEVAELRAGISTESVYAGTTIINIPVGIKYFWGDGQVMVPASMGFGPVAGLHSETTYSEDYETYGTMMYGSNFRRVSSSNDPSGGGPFVLFNSGFATNESNDLEHSIYVGKQDYALFELSYSGDTPQLTVMDPDEQPYELVEGENLLIQEVAAEDSASGMEEKRVYISVVAPQAGEWVITSDTPITSALFDVEGIAHLTEVQATEVGNNTYEVEWQVEHSKGTEQVAIYLTEDNEADSGRLLADQIAVNEGTTTFTLPDSLPSGDYYVKAMLMDGDTPLDHRYSETSIAYTNAFEPDAPTQVEVVPIGNGFFQVAWDVNSTSDGFMIELLDEDGQPIANTGMIELDGEQQEAIIGGLFEREDGELFGLMPGEAYKVAVTAFNVLNDVNVYSETTISELTYLPNPQPAEIELDVSLDDGIVRKEIDENGQVIYYVNRDTVNLAITTDQTAETILQINDGLEESLDIGEAWEESVELEEGRNLVRVMALNEHGDFSEAGVEIVVDTGAPDLKIESPSQVHVTVDGTIHVKGTAEPGSVVTVNGAHVNTDSLGQFETVLSMDGFLSRTVLITAKDRAGNQTHYEAVVSNQSVDIIEDVQIRPLISDDAMTGMNLMSTEQSETYPMQVGEEQAFELVGVDEQGNVIKLNPNQVEWHMLLGEQYGSLSADGVFRTNHAGEMVITASYALSDDYALENTLIVEATGHHSGDPDVGGDPDEWYVPPTSGDQGSGGSTGRQPPADIDSVLQNMLRNLIQAESDVAFINAYPLLAGEDTIIQVGSDLVLRIREQAWDETIGVGIGRVIDPQRYQSDNKQFLSEIYEIKTNLPVQFNEPPVLSLRFAWGEIDNTDKAGLYWFNEQEERWEYIGNTLNPMGSTISAQLPHFSKYAVIYDETLRTFSDMANRWSRNTVYRLASAGIIDGIEREGAYVYEPTRSITRQEFTKLLTVASNVSIVNGELSAGDFVDGHQVSNWAEPYMAAAVERGWIGGSLENGRLHLRPQRPITRAEAAVMVARMLEGVLETNDAADGMHFIDEDQIPAWAKASIASLQSSGIISGYPDGTFRPRAAISREEGAELIKHVIDYLYSQGRRVQ